MPKNVDIVKIPESEQLSKKRDELSALEEELAYGELELHILKMEMDSFQLRYMQIVGMLLAEFDNINDQIAQIEEKLNPFDYETKRAAEEAHARAEESWRTSNNVLKEDLKIQPTEDLKKLYWEVARKIHPDLSTDEGDKTRRQELMVQANVAFETGDEEKLRAILQDWTPASSGKENGDTPELMRISQMITRIQRRLEQIQSKIGEISKSELSELRGRVTAAEKKGRDLLGEMSEEIGVNLVLAKHRLKTRLARANHGT